MDYQPHEAFARQLDETDPLRRFREQFHIPCRSDGKAAIYFCGHSLGLQPKAARGFVEQELDEWAKHGVEAHFNGPSLWYSYHELFRESGARLVGANPGEVVLMNSLTVNLHLLLMGFYRPSAWRSQILMDEPIFPSDRYAVQSQLSLHGFDPAASLRTVKPRVGEHIVNEDDIDELLDDHGKDIRLVFLNGVNYITGQLLDIPRITAVAHKHGCRVGFDLAHAAGNVEIKLHEWDVDFAVWCSYKYLNGGPGAVAGCFVHEKHAEAKLPRLAGWWGNDPATRFSKNEQTRFVPQPGADGWQVSNPPILALAPLRASLALFEEAGMPALRVKSEALTGYLFYLLDQLPQGRYEVITPREAKRRGCQVSILVRDKPRELLTALDQAGVMCDFREPNVIRVAPVPLYNTFEEVWRFAQILARI